jgi:hypothetical protein
MSETTNNSNGNGTATLDADQMSAFLAYQEKERIRKEKLAAAKEARQRTNNRGLNPDGSERNATQAFLTTLGDLLVNWADAYAEDPDQLVRRLREQLIPSVNAVANTASTQMAGAQDQFRQLLNQYHAPAKATTAAPTGKDAAK